MIEEKWLIYLLLLISTKQTHEASMSCSYGGRGSLSSICTNANAAYFRKTSYRFDNLDETVTCVNCNLQIIDHGTFDLAGNQIKYLNLENSQITVLRPQAFVGLVFLKKLNMKNNHIAVVPPNAFEGVTKIEDLRLDSNVIETLVSNGFKELVNLKMLNLSKNKIRSIDYSAFSGLDNLETLELSDNEINRLDYSFDHLPSVLFINMENNKLVQIDLSRINLSSLIDLNLAQNKLKRLRKDQFFRLFRLQNLNLTSNPIETIEMGAFHGLNYLERLDLSRCLLGNVQKGLFKSLHQLRILDLAYNRMTAFHISTFLGLSELRKLNISHNKIESGMLALNNLHILDLSFNNIKYLGYKELVQYVPALAYFELENNPLPCYLKKEMEDYFVHDNFLFNLGTISDGTCNDSRPIDADLPVEEAVVSTTVSTVVYISKSGGHEYVLYVFMVFSIVIMAFLFYLQYRDRQDIGTFTGRSDISEAQLLSDDADTY